MIVSVHAKDCNNDTCSNSDVCYHIQNQNSRIVITYQTSEIDEIVKNLLLQPENKIYYSLFDVQHIINVKNFFKNDIYRNNISFTFSERLIYFIKLIMNYSNLNKQISIYDLNKLPEVDDKTTFLYLLKDNETFNNAINFMKINKESPIHFSISSTLNFNDAKFKDLKKNILELLKTYLSYPGKCSLDSCLIGSIIEKNCPYETEYVNINKGGLAKCPFSPDSQTTKSDEFSIKSVSDYAKKPCYINNTKNCKFKHILKEE